MATTVELRDGGYVEYWLDPSGTSDPDTLHVQKHNADGSLAGPEYLHATRSEPTILALSDGGYVVGMNEGAPGGTILRAEVFAASGGHLTEFTAGKDWSLVASDNGAFAVSSTYTTNHNFTHPDGLITVYDNSGRALTATGHVYSTSGSPTVSADAEGVFHVAWTEGSRSHDLAIDPRNPPDLASPPPPAISYVDDNGPELRVTAGGWTNDNTPTIRVPVSEAGYVAVGAFGDPGQLRFEITADDLARGYKDVALSTTTLSDGTATFEARVEDADGMVSGVATMQIVIDTQVPGQPTISHVTDDAGASQGEVASGGSTDDTTPTVQIALGAATQVNDLITVSDHGSQVSVLGVNPADLDRGYVTTTLNLAEGGHSLTAEVRDQAGNVGAPSAAFDVTVQADASTDHRPVIGDDTGIAVHATLYEKNLPHGTSPDSAALSFSGVFQVNSPDGISRLTIDGHLVVENDGAAFAHGPLTFETGLGETLSITGYDTTSHQVSFTYTLDSAVHHQQGGQPPVINDDRPLIEVVDHDGDVGHAILQFGIVDDMPSLTWETAGAAAGTTASGNALANDQLGADGAHVANAFSRMNSTAQLDANGQYTVRGDFGTIHITSSGDWTYQADAGAAAGSVDRFQFAVTDGDGSDSRSSDHLDITIAGGSSGGTSQNLHGGDSPQSLAGGAGDDTITAGKSADTITGGDGNDVLRFETLSWQASSVTDFHQGQDRIDFSALFQQAGYTGSDPVADGYVSFKAGSGGTEIYFDPDGRAAGNPWPFHITSLVGVQIGTYSWAQLSGATPPPPPQGQSVGFATTSISQDEGNSGVTHFQFTVTRSGDASSQLSIHWTGFAGGTGQAQADDFASGMIPVGSLTFMPGETSKVLDIGVVGDSNPEADEAFRLHIDNQPGITVTSAWADGLIRNDDTGGGTGGPGQVYTANPPGATVVGGAGDDTINASQGADRLTGGAGNDDFVFRDLPWNHGHITDFVVGADKLDLSAIFQAAGYTGTDPVADGRMTFQQDNAGNTTVYFDRDQPNGGDWPFQIVTLDHVSASGLTWATLSTGGGPTGGGGSGGSTQGQVITSDQYGDTLVGGAGNDTLTAGQGPDVMSGNGGADQFVWNALPWRAGAVTDFTPGVDKLDLRPLFQQAGYSGSDPIADHHLEFRDDGQGNTAVYFDRDAPNAGDWPFLITTLQGVSPGQIGAGDWLFR